MQQTMERVADQVTENINATSEKMLALMIHLGIEFVEHKNPSIPAKQNRTMAIVYTNLVVGFYMRLAVVGLGELKPKELEFELMCVIKGVLSEADGAGLISAFFSTHSNVCLIHQVDRYDTVLPLHRLSLTQFFR